jgi:hypothetical protein
MIKAEGIILPDFEIDYKDIAIKTILCWHKIGQNRELM